MITTGPWPFGPWPVLYSYGTEVSNLTAQFFFQFYPYVTGQDVSTFVELGGGVDDVQGWCRDGANIELGFR